MKGEQKQEQRSAVWVRAAKAVSNYVKSSSLGFIDPQAVMHAKPFEHLIQIPIKDFTCIGFQLT